MIRLAFMAILVAGAAGAADFSDPDWPCIQRKQPHLSLGSVWSGPLPDAAVEERAKAPEIQALAQRLEQRRLAVEEAETLISDYAQGKDAAALAALYLATFEKIDATRTRIIAGIARYAHKQEAMDAEINARRAEMAELQAAENPDFDRIDALEEQLDWDMRVFRDRQQSLIYVCETPVLLEQRAFALGRAVAAHLPK